jgi:hypothetical protein
MDQIMKPRLMFVIIAKSVFLGLVITVLLILAIDYAPALAQHALKPSTSAQCLRLKVGMGRGQVQSEIERWLPPRYESVQNDHMEFANFDDGVCRVYFEGQKDQVESVQFERLSTSKWVLRGD